jgi:hypothetical protein
MKSVWAIIICLGLMLPVSIVMVFVTMAHPLRPRTRPASHMTGTVPCNCQGQCSRTRQ